MDDKQVVCICKALSDVNRLHIVQILTKGERCACDILENLQITQPTLSHHMKILAEADLVISRKDGKWMHYSLNCDVLTDYRKFIAALHCSGRNSDGKGACCS